MKKILVVDDSSMIRKLLGDIIRKRGYQVMEASSGEESISKYKEENPDLVFMDIIMGNDRKNGIHALSQICEYDEKALVVMVTSIGEQEEVIQECVNAGAVDYIAKPFDESQILNALDRFLNE